MKVDKSVRDFFINVKHEYNIFLEGSIIKVIEPDENDNEFSEYLNDSEKKDKDTRRSRLEITKQVQKQNVELINKQKENDTLMQELQEALKNAEDAKQIALNDLDIIQKKKQTELIGTIVKVALFIIVAGALATTAMYIFAILMKSETQLIGSTWSNMTGILLTNAFSIVGTIMGIKYASKK